MLPRLLILDDLFGRNLPDGPNTDRESLCAHFLWQDVTGDASTKSSKQKVLQPTAEAVFCRAQTPAAATIGDTVENDLESALDAVRCGWPEAQMKRRGRKPKVPPPRWSMVLIDLCFYTGLVTEESNRRTPGMPEGRPGDDDPRSYFGLTLLDAIHREFPELPIFILSSKPRKDVSLEFSRRGALGFIDRSALEGPELLEQALWNHGLLPDPTGEVVGHSIPLLLALREARRAAGHRENVMVRGERGTGKELLARYLHRCAKETATTQREAPLPENSKLNTENSSRFVAVNSAVFTPNLFASELFGIQPRTTTGVDGKVGLIEMAKGGDLFLDEIADMPSEVQAALMRVLQERQITRVGGRESLPMDVRFLSATNADLEDPDHTFRPDLLDRLRSGGTIWLPPLRDRPGDIPLLAEKLLREAETQREGIRPRQIIPEAMEKLLAHDWPGNVRELRGVIFDAVTRHPDVEHLVADHVRITSKLETQKPKADDKSRSARSKEEQGAVESLSDLLERMQFTKIDPLLVNDWAGRLPDLQHEQARLAARLLQAALEATKRRTPDHPDDPNQTRRHRQPLPARRRNQHPQNHALNLVNC
ncbi:MAG: sigma-54-dependent Fis family transcriptional regulator [Akkermansiaceae bacterium]|nr:sigma-54-dependent Fis family transcriptional regulator [Akkermansiaceae bacterium]